MGRIIPYIMENKNVPNHQPDRHSQPHSIQAIAKLAQDPSIAANRLMSEGQGKPCTSTPGYFCLGSWVWKWNHGRPLGMWPLGLDGLLYTGKSYPNAWECPILTHIIWRGNMMVRNMYSWSGQVNQKDSQTRNLTWGHIGIHLRL